MFPKLLLTVAARLRPNTHAVLLGALSIHRCFECWRSLCKAHSLTQARTGNTNGPLSPVFVATQGALEAPRALLYARPLWLLHIQCVFIVGHGCSCGCGLFQALHVYRSNLRGGRRHLRMPCGLPPGHLPKRECGCGARQAASPLRWHWPGGCRPSQAARRLHCRGHCRAVPNPNRRAPFSRSELGKIIAWPQGWLPSPHREGFQSFKLKACACGRCCLSLERELLRTLHETAVLKRPCVCTHLLYRAEQVGLLRYLTLIKHDREQ